MTTKIKDWWAKRAGGRITIYGKDARGNDVKAVGVDRINGRKGKAPLATDRHGQQFELVD